MATAGDDLLKITLDGKTFYCNEEKGDRIEEDLKYASEIYSKILEYWKDVRDLPDGVYLETEVPVHEPEVKKPASRSTIIERAPKTWTTKETDALISQRIEKDDLFKQNKTHTTLWNSISNDMEKQGYIGVTSQQCSNKWKSLKRSYMETIDHNTKTGEAPGNKPSTKPDFTLHSSESSDCSTSSSNKKAAQKLVSENKHQSAQKLVSENKHQSKNCSDASGSDDNEFNVVAPKKKQRIVGREKRKSSFMIDFLTEYKEEQKEDRKKNEDILERHHQEKMKRFDRYLDILEDNRN